MTTRYVGSSAIDHLASSPSNFVGRERELVLIKKQYEAVKGGNLRVVLLTGDLGIGKTRLLHEIAARAGQEGPIVLRGGASDVEGMPPYLPFLEALGRYIHETSPDQLRQQMAVPSQALVSILPELAARLGDVPVPYPLPPEQARLRLYQAVGTTLEAISMPQTLILTLDDLHWADTATLNLLCYIARHYSQARLLILGTYRASEIFHNPPLELAVNELIRLRVLTTVMLDPLSTTEIEELATSYIGGPLCSIVSELLYKQSEGNPFFAEELLRGWVETGVLVQENTNWVAVASLEHSLPSSIVGALRQRFARLSAAIIDHLRIAAIIGRTFDLSLLATVEGQEVEVVEECLLEATRARLIQTDQAGVFNFSHEKIRECLYAEVSTSRRRRLHETIGRVLEARYTQEVAPRRMHQLAELAFHFAHSGDRVRGVNYSWQAAEQALQSSAIKEAIAHYRMALEMLTEGDERRGELLLGLGEALRLAGAEHEAAAAYETAVVHLLLVSGKQQAAAQATSGLAVVQWRSGALQEARAAFEQTLELLGNCPSAEVVLVLVSLATLLSMSMGQQSEGTTYASRAQEMANTLADSSLQAVISRAFASTRYLSCNDIPMALQLLEQAQALAERSGDASEVVTCYLYQASGYYWMAEIRQAYEISLRRMEFIEFCQQPYQIRDAYSWLALLHASLGEWEEAEQAIQRAQALVDSQSTPAPLASLGQIRSFLAFQREDYVAAERELQATIANQQRGSIGLMFCSCLLGPIQAALGKREEASAAFADLEVLLTNVPTGTLPTAPILTCQALIAVALGDQEWAEKLYLKLLPFEGQHYLFLVDRVLGMTATLCGDWEKATMHLVAAEATSQREGLCSELARTLLALAELEERNEQGDTTRMKNYLERALALFVELNIADVASRIRARLQSLTNTNGLTFQTLPANLSRREAEVLQLVARGKSNRQIARELILSERTVANHLSHIFAKTRSENRVAATTFAIRHNLV